MMDYYNQYNNSDDINLDAVNSWFYSDTWKCICNDADSGDTDSLELMQHAYDLLNNLLFHLQNNSGHARVTYELEQFNKLLENEI